MEKIGVEAIVSGLSSFLGDMGKVDKSISGLSGSSSLLGRAFSGLGSIVEWLTGSVFRVLEYTLGSLLSSAIQGVISQVQELISTTIEAGNEFQSLEIRLNNFNFDKATESAKGYEAAQAEAVKVTREQLEWLQKIAASTPYDLTDIANVYTLARSYGFANDEAQGLTRQITDFAASMGLGNTEITRIIKNFGQMTQLGKVTQRELNDLAVGAFVPVNDILEIMRNETGLAGDAFDDFRNSTDGVNSFMNAFAQLVEQRAAGAAEKMARTFKGATDNAKDFIKSLFGLNVVKPILDVIGGRIADFVASFTESSKWEQVVAATVRIGDSLGGIVDKLLNLGGTAEQASDGFLKAIEGVADWLESNDDNIIQWVKDLEKWVNEKAIPAILTLKDKLFGTENQPGAIQKVGTWFMEELLPFLEQQLLPVLSDVWDMITGATNFDTDMATSLDEINNTPLQNLLQIIRDLQPAIAPLLDLFKSLGDVIITAFGGNETQTFGQFVKDVLVPALEDLKLWVDNNREGLALLLQAFFVMSVIGTVIGLLTSLVIWLVLVSFAFGSLLVISGIVLVVVAAVKMMQFWWEWFKNSLSAIITFIITRFTEFKTNISNTFNEVMDAIKNKDWLGVGKALVSGIWNGIKSDWYRITELAKSLGTAALTAFNTVFKIKSPSAEMWDIGENIVLGLAKGISDSTALAVGSMKNMANKVIAQPMQMASAMAPSSVSNTTTNNYNLQVNTSAPSEPIMQDFNMMSSLAS